MGPCDKSAEAETKRLGSTCNQDNSRYVLSAVMQFYVCTFRSRDNVMTL
jgi:hypothetical protein